MDTTPKFRPTIKLKNLYYLISTYSSDWRMVPVGWYKFPAFYSLAAPSHVVRFRRSNALNRNRTRNVLTQTSSHNQPRNHDLAYTLITKSVVILQRHTPSWAMMGPCYLFPGYYSVHPRNRRVVLSQIPHVLWASGCWHYERTRYSRRPLKGTGVSIYLDGHLTCPNHCWKAAIFNGQLDFCHSIYSCPETSGLSINLIVYQALRRRQLVKCVP